MINERVFITRKDGFNIERDNLIEDIKDNFNIILSTLSYYLIYDIFNIEEDVFEVSKKQIFGLKNKDIIVKEPEKMKHVIAYEFLPGQFDQRADSAEQAIRLISPSSKAIVSSGIYLTFDEDLTESELNKLKKYLINQVESREKDLKVFSIPTIKKPSKVYVIDGFIDLKEQNLKDFYDNEGFAMSFADLKFVQTYFRNEKRNPFETELKVLDTYWSDHCRHTTFETKITDAVFPEDEINQKIYEMYQNYILIRKKLGRNEKPITLMDLATINAKLELSKGNLDDLEISEEVNAASIYVEVDVDGKPEKWLLMFKNETHNHPTEIEPFGGASTCIGGAIRDPLSGRSYVYSAMRITGAADITEKVENTLEGKLPQKVVSKVATKGYASYGNQIGLATTFVEELYHEGYKAKRMEIGAVVGAVKADYVRRETPAPGDKVILLGGRTGRDGIGGATGSSKTHNKESIETSSAEVQKGNAPEERKIQRLFRNEAVTKLIKKSNDFGAGGVSVAIGELADGITIDLDKVPVKYQGINGTELAISESQERMSVVVDEKDVNTFMQYALKENIEAVVIAEITKEKRLIMKWQGDVICDLDRSFIDSAGVREEVTIKLPKLDLRGFLYNPLKGDTKKDKLIALLSDLNIASKKGMEEQFDATIGRTTVLSPYGGKYQLTKSQASVHKLPVHGKTNTCHIMTYGFNPYLTEKSPYHGSQYAVIESLSKIVASGGQYQNVRFTFQEYFERLEKDPVKWSKPFSALLGAYKALANFELAAIGGKDSMSGTYHNLHVPPTLVSFAITTSKLNQIISNEFKEIGSYIYILNHVPNDHFEPNYERLIENYQLFQELHEKGAVLSANAIAKGGIAHALINASLGNKIGLDITTYLPIFDHLVGSIIVETSEAINHKNAIYLGKTTSNDMVSINEISMHFSEIITLIQKPLKNIYPWHHIDERKLDLKPLHQNVTKHKPLHQKRCKVLIPVFPGTNCEYDSYDAFISAGAEAEIIVFNNMSEKHISESINLFEEKMKETDILMFSGGFSSGDEPDGSGKFIANIIRNEKIAKSIENHLQNKKLILGICNGFQALVLSGLLPYGSITETSEQSPILFKNTIDRHVAKFVTTKVMTTSSPWLEALEDGEIHTIPVSHGEGRFIANEKTLETLYQNNQIAFTYVDDKGNPTYNPIYNPNGSAYAIEGIISKDGLILGKMGHSERYHEGLFQNIKGNKKQNIFKSAVKYIKGDHYHE